MKYFCTYNSVTVFVPVCVSVCGGGGVGVCVLVHEKLQITDSMVHSVGI